MPVMNRFSTTTNYWAQREIDKLRRKNTELETRVNILTAADREVSELHQEIAILKGNLLSYRLKGGCLSTTGREVAESRKNATEGELAEFHDHLRQLEIENARLGLLLKDYRLDQERRRSILKQQGKKVTEIPLTGEARGSIVRPMQKGRRSSPPNITDEASALHEAIELFRLRKADELFTLESCSTTMVSEKQLIGSSFRRSDMGSLEGEVEQLRSLNSALNSRVSSLNEANEQLRTEFDCRTQDLQLVMSEMKRFLSEAKASGFTAFYSSSARLDQLFNGLFSRGRSQSPTRSLSSVSPSRRGHMISPRAKLQ